jgi:DnaJ-class molecular chaperone
VKFGGYGRGDLNLRLSVHVPEHPGKAEKALYRQLQEQGGSRKNRKGWWK